MELRVGTWVSGMLLEVWERKGRPSVRGAVLASSWTGVVVLVEQWSSRSVSCLYGSSQSDYSKDTQGEHPGLDGQRLFVGYGVHVYR